MKGKQITVALTGMNAEPANPGPGIVVARCIKESANFNGRIIGLGYDAMESGLYLSKYCDAGYLLPYPSSGEQALFQRLQAIQEKESIDVLIPCLDAELLSMCRLKADLESLGIHMLIPSVEQLTLRNKDRLPELGKMVGVKTPRIERVYKSDFFYNCHSLGWRYPLVVKGIFYDACVVYSAEEGIAVFRRLASTWGLPVLAQEYVMGEEANLTGLGDGQGQLIAPVMMAKRGVTEKGKAWAGVSIYDETLKNVAELLIKKTKWPGPLEVEVVRDRHGQYQLIEINPRFPAWVYLTAGVGRNLPALLVDMILGKPTAEFKEVETGTSFVRHAEETIVPLSHFESVAIAGKRS